MKSFVLMFFFLLSFHAVSAEGFLNSNKTTIESVGESIVIKNPRVVLSGVGYGISGSSSALSSAIGICALYGRELVSYTRFITFTNDNTIAIDTTGEIVEFDPNAMKIKTIICR